MFNKLRIRFIVMATSGLLALLVLIVAVSGLLSYQELKSGADDIIAALATMRSTFFAKKDDHDEMFSGELRGRKGIVNMETPYESRYFSVILTASGEVFSVNTENIVSVTEDEAVEYARAAVARNRSAGFMNDLRYNVYRSASGATVVFLDYSRSLLTFRNTLVSTCLISLAGFLLVGVLFVVFSGRIVKPMADSYEKQKQFITAAGHEIRTPLTIIDADTEILQMDLGENEWLADIQTQTHRLAGLTNDLIRLSRMDEGESQFQMLDFPLSDVVDETARSFQAVAAGRGLALSCDTAPDLTMCGDEGAIRQLVTILLDNAVKYTPEDSAEPVRLSLTAHGQAVTLAVTNASQPVGADQLRRFFDRFYRTEQSRNSEKGGYGLGLAIAKAITDAHKGKISASAPDDSHVRVTATLPLKR